MARRRTICIIRGATFAHRFIWKDQSTNTVVSTDGYAATFTIENRSGSTVVAATNTTGQVVLGGSDGTATVVLAPAVTAALTSLTHGGEYSLYLTKAGHKTVIAQGHVGVLEVAGL